MKWIVITGIIILALVIFIFVFRGYRLFAAQGFNSAKWKAQYNSKELHNPRLVMIPHLKRSVLHVGMDKSAVRDILGPPEKSRDQTDIYALGVSEYGIDFEYYYIEYDSNDKVIKFYLMRG